MTARFDVSAAGFLVLDILGRPTAALPPEGGATHIDEITMTVAGTAGATAVACAILGLRTRIAARVGRDSMGDFLVGEMERRGLDCTLVQRDPVLQTSCSILPIRPSGERSAFFVAGATRTFGLGPDEVDTACDARFVHLGGTGLLDAFDGAPSVAFLRRARKLGARTVLDLILAGPAALPKVLPLLPHVDYFVPSIEEARAMAGAGTPADLVQWFRARGAHNVILTLGAEGVYVSPESGGDFALPALRVKAVDTTGCGDSFTAGIIAGLARGMGLREAASLATAVAARVAMGLGSQGQLVSFEDAVALMRGEVG
jgi:sugar/nucleoside kinase (ribokinase family)